MNLTVHRGDDKTWELTVTNKQTGATEDITGCTIKLTVRSSHTSAVFLQKDFTLTDPTNGVAEVTVEDTDTSGLSNVAHEYVYDVQITKTDNSIETLCEGKFIVLPDITY